MAKIKSKGGFSNVLLGMITSARGGISSKIVVGGIGYIVLMISMIVLCFINPQFPGIDDIIVTLIITSASLLGLTTIENTKDMVNKAKMKKTEENSESEAETVSEE